MSQYENTATIPFRKNTKIGAYYEKVDKTNISMICAICLILCMLGGFAYAEVSDESSVAANPVSMYLNGIKMSDGIMVKDTTYVPLRAFYNVIGNQTDIAWNEKNKYSYCNRQKPCSNSYRRETTT